MTVRATAGAVAALFVVLAAVFVAGRYFAEDAYVTPRHPGVVVPAGASAPSLSRYLTHEELDELASRFAMRPYEIRCPTAEEWADDPWSPLAWGYTRLEWSYAILDPFLCAAALDVVDGSEAFPAWARALAVSVIVHESYHGRRWSGRANEALVECKAIRHWTVAMRLLGASEEIVDELKGWALAHHWRLVRLADEYHLESCGVPNPW